MPKRTLKSGSMEVVLLVALYFSAFTESDNVAAHVKYPLANITGLCKSPKLVI